MKVKDLVLGDGGHQSLACNLLIPPGKQISHVWLFLEVYLTDYQVVDKVFVLHRSPARNCFSWTLVLHLSLSFPRLLRFSVHHVRIWLAQTRPDKFAKLLQLVFLKASNRVCQLATLPIKISLRRHVVWSCWLQPLTDLLEILGRDFIRFLLSGGFGRPRFWGRWLRSENVFEVFLCFLFCDLPRIAFDWLDSLCARRDNLLGLNSFGCLL